MDDSRRKFYRTDFKVHGVFKKHDREFKVSLMNISLKGVLAEIEENAALTVGDQGELAIRLPNSEITIIISNATLVHNSLKNQFGFVFNEIDAESMIHLRRLLELNSVLEGEIEKELTHLKDN